MRGYTITCDVCKTETSDMKDQSTLPDGWAIIGSTVQTASGLIGDQLDVGPNCLLSSFPAVIPQNINQQVTTLQLANEPLTTA